LRLFIYFFIEATVSASVMSIKQVSWEENKDSAKLSAA